MPEIIETVVVSLVSAFFASLSAVYFSKRLDFKFALKGLRQEIIINHETCTKMKPRLLEILDELERAKINEELKFQQIYVNLKNVAYQYFSVNGFLLYMDPQLIDRLVALGSIIDIINRAIERQETIIIGIIDKYGGVDITSVPHKNTLFANIRNNILHLIEAIDNFEETYNSQEIKNFIK